MEKRSSIKNRGLRLPPGFRFHPTDEELLTQYLCRKVTNLPLPASVIPETDVCKADPWDLPGDCDSERYFFSIREAKYPNGNRSNRSTGSGYWKATGIDKQIGKKIIGMKKTLVFYKGKPPNGTRTNWVLHEYRLVDSQQESYKMNWVLCRVFLKKRSSNNNNNNNNTRKEDDQRAEREKETESDEEEAEKKIKRSCPMIYYDFMRKDKKKGRRRCCDLNLTPTCPCSSPSSASVCSSALTQTSSNDSHNNNNNNHEESSCREIKFCLFL